MQGVTHGSSLFNYICGRGIDLDHVIAKIKLISIQPFGLNRRMVLLLFSWLTSYVTRIVSLIDHD